jgi:hypothetical protein
LESKSQDQNSSRKTTPTEKDSKEFEKHNNNNNNKVANVLENKAGSFLLSWFFSLLFHQELQKKRRRRGRGKRVGAAAHERERERESAMSDERNFRRSICSLFFCWRNSKIK